MAQKIRTTSERPPEHPINDPDGEHAANDKPVVNWALYHDNTKTLTLKRKQEQPK